MTRPLLKFVAASGVIFLFSLPGAFSGRDAAPPMTLKEMTLETLAAVYDEMKDMPPYPGEPFIRMDVFIGEDDDDTNKDIHAVLLAAKEHGRPALRVQIVIMERRRGLPVIRIARETRSFLCVLENDAWEVRSFSFTAAEIDGLAPGLLKAVRDKKRLLGRRV